MLTRDQQRVVRALGGWIVLDVLERPDLARTDHQGGSSHPPGWPEGHQLDYRPSGISIVTWDSATLTRTTVLRVPWAAVKAHARALPEPWRTAATEHREARQQHQRDYPRFAATGEAVGCGRAPSIGPPTRAQALYADQYADHHKRAWLPYVRAGVALRAAEAALLDRALPLAADDEPTDLLELLDAL